MSGTVPSMVWAGKERVSDPTIYPETDRMGESELQRLMIELLRPMLARFLAERGDVAHVGANQFIYGVQFAPTRCIAPDLYVFPGIAQSRVEKVWKLWNEVVVPSFCLEVVSGDYEKDYVSTPAACAEIGVSEVVIFDPEASAGSELRHLASVSAQEAGPTSCPNRAHRPRRGPVGGAWLLARCGRTRRRAAHSHRARRRGPGPLPDGARARRSGARRRAGGARRRASGA